jgi:hypothetical protein
MFCICALVTRVIVQVYYPWLYKDDDFYYGHIGEDTPDGGMI